MAKDKAKPSEVSEQISERKLRQLLKDARTVDENVHGITGDLREKIGRAVERDHLNKEVFSCLRRWGRKSPEKLADFLDALDYGLDASGLRDRAASAPRMPFEEQQEQEQEQEDAEEFPAAAE